MSLKYALVKSKGDGFVSVGSVMFSGVCFLGRFVLCGGKQNVCVTSSVFRLVRMANLFCVLAIVEKKSGGEFPRLTQPWLGCCSS